MVFRNIPTLPVALKEKLSPTDPKANNLMEKRIGTITILIQDRSQAPEINQLISEHSAIVLCRQGLPLQDRPVSVISLIVEGLPDQINALTGQIGRLTGVQCKSILTR